MRLLIIIGLLLGLFLSAGPVLAEDGFTHKDRELLIELRVRLEEMDKRFEQVDKRFEQVDKRFEQVDKRFEQVDKRFEQVHIQVSDLRQDMNTRFEQVDKRFEQVHIQISDLRQDMNTRFEQMFHFFYILAGIFTSLVVAVIGFAYWDRRTMIREARREAIEFIEKEGVLRRLVDALKELAREDVRLAEALKRFNL